MFKPKLWMTFALALALAVPSWAQRGQGRGMFGGSLGLLRVPAVQEELKLTDEQKVKLQQVGEELMQRGQEFFQGLRDLPPEERQKKMQEFQAEVTKRINTVLNANQQKRLRQLTLQQQGPSLIAQDASLAKELKIKDEQKQKIGSILQDANERRRALFQSAGGGGGGGFSPEMRTKMEEITRQTNEKIAALLTDAQKKQWKELCGAPFKFPEQRRAAR